MDRREVLRHMGVVAGIVFLAPGCDFSKQNILRAYGNLQITSKEKVLLSTICDVIIPSGDGIKGAKDIQVEDFILVMVNDCYDPDYQLRFTGGLRRFQQYVKDSTGNKFQRLSPSESEIIVLNLLEISYEEAEAAKEVGEDEVLVQYFLKATKDLVVQGYMTSEYFMTEIMPYKLVPGPYKGKAKIQPGEKINIYG